MATTPVLRCNERCREDGLTKVPRGERHSGGGGEGGGGEGGRALKVESLNR